MAGKYIVTTEVGSKEKDEEKWWWDLLFDAKSEAEIFDSFEEAAAAMRKKVTQLIKSCDSYPFDKNDANAPGDNLGVMDELEMRFGGYCMFCEINELVSRTLTNPDHTFCGFQYEDDIYLPFTDDLDRHFAFIANRALVYVYFFDWKLAFNLHDMRDPEKTYYFEYREAHDDGSEKRISVRLIKMEG